MRQIRLYNKSKLNEHSKVMVKMLENNRYILLIVLKHFSVVGIHQLPLLILLFFYKFILAGLFDGH